MRLLLTEDSDLSTLVWVRKIKFYFLWNKSKTFWRGSPRRHFLRMGVKKLTWLLGRAIANGAGVSTALIQGSFHFLLFWQKREPHLKVVCVSFLLKAASKNRCHWDTLALITYFAENFSSKTLQWAQMLADYLGLPALSPSFQCPYLCLLVHLKAQSFPGLPSALCEVNQMAANHPLSKCWSAAFWSTGFLRSLKCIWP